MSEAGRAAPKAAVRSALGKAAANAVEDAPAAAEPGTGPAQVAELRVSGNLMTLNAGLFCIFRQPGGAAVNPATGLPGVRLSVPPGRASRPDAVTISTFRQDGWLADQSGENGAALVRVAQGPAQVLVTIYQAPNQPPDAAPRLQVLQLSAGAAAAAAAPASQPRPGPAPDVMSPDVIAHVQRAGDVGATFGDWIGTRGSKQWIEGFAITPRGGVAAEDFEYQAVLGRGWLSPWVSEGKFCGSRGMALPLLGLRVRLRGAAAAAFACTVTATFVDGAQIGPVADDEACEAESLSPLESFRVTLDRRAASRAEPVQVAPAGKSAAKGGTAKKSAAPAKRAR